MINNIFVFRGLSPNKFNNPGFSILKIKNNNPN